MIEPAILELAQTVLDRCRARGWRVVTAESCTGGLIAGALTAPAGSSDVVEGGFVTYSNAMKASALGVPQALLETYGAVSEPVAAAMAAGALANAPEASLAVAVTGIAGPGGGSPAKPVGLVYLAAAGRGGWQAVRREIFAGDRTAVRQATIIAALELLVAGSQS